VLNRLAYDFALWVDSTTWSTRLHESYYMYNWVESTHVLTLMFSLGLLLLIDLRMLGYALPNVSASRLAERLHWPMLAGFSVMVVTGVLLFYAIPVRTTQSLWFRIKLVLLFAAFINALVFHRQLRAAGADWDSGGPAPRSLRIGAALSIGFWSLIVICGRLIAYDWYDCVKNPSPLVSLLAGCVDDQTLF
jgi:hypothetical protein